jgi:hypothetical protein
MNKLKSFLVAVKVFDAADGSLSLTNLMMMVLIGKIAFTPSMDWTVVSSLFLALASYNLKKAFAKNKADREVASQNQHAQSQSELESIKSELKSVVQIINMRGK